VYSRCGCQEVDRHSLRKKLRTILPRRARELIRLARYPFRHPPGHFYSPLPNLESIRKRERLIFSREDPLLGIDLREHEQFRLLQELVQYYPELPFNEQPTGELLYGFNNRYYRHGDAVFLYSMLRHVCPRRLVEVGSGHSTAAALDTIRLFLGDTCEVTCIEPHPKRLDSLVGSLRPPSFKVLASPLQEIETARFESLEENDILLIDSTHVSKVDSDVNHLLFRVLPRLRPGVLVQFHDIYFPFEYPAEWVYMGRAWNEAYIVRAFLSFNVAFEIVLWADYVARYHREWFEARMPLVLEDPGNTLWIRKL
jgi:hypothetical protein